MCTPTQLAGSGPISKMVARELESIRAAFLSLQGAWAAGDFPAAALALNGLASLLSRHMRWEEASLLENLSPRLARAREHCLHHESLQRELARIELLIARREGDPTQTDEELELALAELEIRLDAHAVEELTAVCLELDAVDPVLVATIAAALRESHRDH